MSTIPLTPVEYHNPARIWVKRDDLYTYAGVSGGKVRSCRYLAEARHKPKGLVTASSRMSPQLNIVAHIATELGVLSYGFIPARNEPWTFEMRSAASAGMVFHEIRPGYNTVICARARSFAEATNQRYIPFGMECAEAVLANRAQVANLPRKCKRLVVPVGSAMTLAGILWGLQDLKWNLPVLGVMVGALPFKRLDKWAPKSTINQVRLEPAGIDYHEPAHPRFQQWNGIDLDPIYEAKCIRFLQPGDCFWLVGIREILKVKETFSKEFTCGSPGTHGYLTQACYLKTKLN